MSFMGKDAIYQFMAICLQIANLADEKNTCPFQEELHMGYRVFSGYMRSGVKAIIELQGKYYYAVEKETYASISEKYARDFLKECFGDSEIDSINDTDKQRIIALCQQIEKEWKEREEE